MKQDIQILGEEKIPKLLLKFSIPCVMGLLIGALYNIVDQVFIGNSSLGYLGNAATTALSILLAVVILVLTAAFFRKLPKRRNPGKSNLRTIVI